VQRGLHSDADIEYSSVVVDALRDSFALGSYQRSSYRLVIGFGLNAPMVPKKRVIVEFYPSGYVVIGPTGSLG
jgi:hypothetical protein